MIKINLLPYRERKKKNDLKRQVLILSVSFGLFFLAVLTLHLYIIDCIGGLEKEVRISENQLRELTKAASEIDIVRGDKRTLEKKIEIINNLETRRLDTVLLLNEMTLTVPPGQIWLTKFSETGASLKLDGVARDNLAIALFMKNLERSPHVKSVDLNSSKQEKMVNTKVQRFSITCGLKKG